MSERGSENDEQPEPAQAQERRAEGTNRSSVPDLPDETKKPKQREGGEEPKKPRDPGDAEAASARVPDLPPEPVGPPDQFRERHREVADIVQQFVNDSDHPTDLSRALSDPTRREGAVATLSELADGRLLRDGNLDDYQRNHPGSGPLFEPVSREINQTSEGESRKAVFAEDSVSGDPVRGLGAEVDDQQVEQVRDYSDRLRDKVTPQVREEVADLAEPYGDASVSIRAKSGDAVLDKVERQVAEGRTDYRVGNVTDAVGARITVADTDQLAQVFQDTKDHLGTGDGGRILEVENRYESPNAHNPSYRVISITATTEVDGQRYPFELQLCTRRSSVASDLEHNTCYKPYIPLDDRQKSRIRQIQAEAAALDQEETRR